MVDLYIHKKLRVKLGKNARETASKFKWEDTIKKIKYAFDKELK